MLLVGIDEVGRGAWAGPLVVGAVSLGKRPRGLADSKQLAKAKRAELAEKILASATFVGIGWADNEEIDAFGLSTAINLAIRRAIRRLDFEAEIIIDGNVNYLFDRPGSKCIVKADEKLAEVMAASIIAKVARDNFMLSQAGEFPDFGFDSNVGYGTRLHSEALKRHGATRWHRLSYQPVMDIANG